MPRIRRGTTGRMSRNWGEVSAVTFQTVDSGVTIDKSSLTFASGVSIDGSGMKDFDGSAYLLSGLRGVGVSGSDAPGSQLLMSAGVTALPSAGKIFTAAMFGMTTLDAVICSGSTPRAGSTDLTVCVDRGGGEPWNSNATKCRWTAFATIGTFAVAVSCSVHYFVIGK